MKALYEFPKASIFGRVLAKSKIYEHAKPSQKIKNLFIREIEKIIWQYKLSPTTINVPATKAVKEIQVITLLLKTDEISKGILQTIDKAIPSPLLFELQCNDKIKYAAAYKRPNATDKTKWVISEHFASDWIKQDNPKLPLPVVFNMEALYTVFLTELIPLQLKPNENLEGLTSRFSLLQSKTRELASLTKRMYQENQFNRQIALNRQLNSLKAEIRALEK